MGYYLITTPQGHDGYAWLPKPISAKEILGKIKAKQNHNTTNSLESSEKLDYSTASYEEIMEDIADKGMLSFQKSKENFLKWQKQAIEKMRKKQEGEE